MLIHAGYDIGLEVSAPTPVSLLLDIHSSRLADIVVTNPLQISGIEIERGHDFYGNGLRRFVAPPGLTRIISHTVVRDSGLVETFPAEAPEIPIAQVPTYCLHFLTGSRYCETDELLAFAWQTFGNVAPGIQRVQAICKFVHDSLRFSYPEARATRSAADALREGTGVCRDYAHLAITLCRCLNIPARYVNGYLGDINVPADPAPMDFSAWFEAYIGHQWVTFDARHNTPRTGRIVIARGRDAADVPMITSFGNHVLKHFTVVCEEVAASRIRGNRLIGDKSAFAA